MNTKERRLEITEVPVRDIKTYDNNTKNHTDEQVDQIKKSIEEFGFNDPIALDENNMIIEGHGRLFAALKLGLERVPVIYLNGLSDEEKRAYMLVHNKLTMNTGFDVSALENELSSITDIDMDSYGLSIGETWFDEFIIPEKEESISVVVDKGKESELVSFLDDNGYEYKVKESE